MKHDEMTVEDLEQQIEGLKKQVLVKKLMAKQKAAEEKKNKISLPNQFVNRMICRATRYFADVYHNASFAITDPHYYTARNLIDKSDALIRSGDGTIKHCDKCIYLVEELDKAIEQLNVPPSISCVIEGNRDVLKERIKDLTSSNEVECKVNELKKMFNEAEEQVLQNLKQED